MRPTRRGPRASTAGGRFDGVSYQGGSHPGDRIDGFPWLVTFLCLLASLTLWFRSTAPALREQQELRAAEERLTRQLVEAARANVHLGERLADLGRDEQALLLELDRRGRHPLEVLDESIPSRHDLEILHAVYGRRSDAPDRDADLGR
jgi:hypothetical protein